MPLSPEKALKEFKEPKITSPSSKRNQGYTKC